MSRTTAARRIALAFVRRSTSRGARPIRSVKRVDLVRQLVDRNDAGHQPERLRLLRLDDAAREAQLARDATADDVVQRAVDDVAELDLGVGEARRVGGHADVGHHGEVEPARRSRDR